MPAGTLSLLKVRAVDGLSSRTTNRSAQCFIQDETAARDFGYVTKEQQFQLFLWNGSSADVTLSAIHASGDAEGISWDATPPDLLATRTSLPVVLTVSIDGPLAFEAMLQFISACTFDPIFTLTGTRAAHLETDVGYLFFPHSWDDGLNETLAWKTDVLIAHDRTEQRIQLRTLPRRSWELTLKVAGAGRRKLETWLGMRKARSLFIPIWRDAVRLAGEIATDSSTIPIIEGSDNLVVGSPVAVWSDWQTAEVRTISGVGATYIAVDAPFSRAWEQDRAMVAPCRYCLSLEQRRVGRFTEDVGSYRLTLLARDDAWEPIGTAAATYRSLPVCPFTPSWEGGDEGIDNKWIRLDNEVGLIEFDVQSEEPVYSREASFLLIGRERINAFLVFLQGLAGRLAPFWLAANDRGFELSAAAAADDAFILIQSIDYEFALKGSQARQHVELITTEGTVIRRMITGVETQPTGEEKLSLDSAPGVALSAKSLNRCAWLELVRLDSDELTLHWIAGDCLQVTVPIVVLP